MSKPQGRLHLHAFRLSVVFGLLGWAVSCSAPGFSSVCQVPETGTPAEKLAAVCSSCQSGIAQMLVHNADRWKRDVLFVVSNTRGMAVKQRALAESLSSAVATLDSVDLDTHIGVISTDVGSWVAPNTPWTMSSGSCDSFEGDDGALQALSCLDRGNLSAGAAAACSAVCPDRRFVPTDGHPFLIRKDGRYNVPAAWEPDPKTGRMIDRGPEYALRCMLMLGDGGCSLSSPLESLRRALDGHRRENAGFFRPGVPLWIVILTDSDDCSMQLARRGEGDPHTQDCNVADPNAPASCYSLGAYRCLARDVICDQPMNVAGSKTRCQERSDRALTPVGTFIEAIRSALPKTPVEVVGLWTTPSLADGGKLVVTQSPRVAGSAGLDFGQGTDASCRAAADPTLTGQAQLRLSKFADSFFAPPLPWQWSRQINLCEPTQYSEALSGLGSTILKGFGLDCLPAPPKLNADGTPACLVGDVPKDRPDHAPESLLPLCSPGCCDAFDHRISRSTPQSDPVIRAACQPEPADCYCALASQQACPGSALVTTWRKDGADDPPNKVTSVRCAVQCPAPWNY